MFGAHAFGQPYFGQGPGSAIAPEQGAFGIGAVQLENVGSGALELVNASSARSRVSNPNSKRASMTFGSKRARITGIDSAS